MSALIGMKSQALTTSDDGTTLTRNHGFIPNADGNFEGRLRYDTSDRTFFVKQGLFYPLELDQVTLTGATGVTEITLIIAREAPQARGDSL